MPASIKSAFEASSVSSMMASYVEPYTSRASASALHEDEWIEYHDGIGHGCCAGLVVVVVLFDVKWWRS
jgi:hypothetical protein